MLRYVEETKDERKKTVPFLFVLAKLGRQCGSRKLYQ